MSNSLTACAIALASPKMCLYFIIFDCILFVSSGNFRLFSCFFSQKDLITNGFGNIRRNSGKVFWLALKSK